MTYELRHFDTPLMRFTATEDTSTPEIEILWVNEEKKALLPLDMDIDGDSVSRWLRHRTIPKNRAYVHSFLSKCGLNLNRPMSILSVSKGLSLNDCYWVVEEGFEGGFSQYNLYENRFSRVLGLIAFTGYGSSVRTSLASCPEFTTNGMLPKWERAVFRVLCRSDSRCSWYQRYLLRTVKMAGRAVFHLRAVHKHGLLFYADRQTCQQGRNESCPRLLQVTGRGVHSRT